MKNNLPSSFKNDGITFKKQSWFLFMAACTSPGTVIFAVHLRLREQ